MAPPTLSGTHSFANDTPLTNGPNDSVSELSWAPVRHHLAVSSWDSTIRVYDFNGSAAGIHKTTVTLSAPVLSCAWSKVSY